MKWGTCPEGTLAVPLGGNCLFSVLRDEERCNELNETQRLALTTRRFRSEGRSGRKDAWRRERQRCSALFG